VEYSDGEKAMQETSHPTPNRTRNPTSNRAGIRDRSRDQSTKRLAAALLGFAAAASGAAPAEGLAVQDSQGRVVYERVTQLNIELPPELAAIRGRLPTERSADVIFRFDGAGSMTEPAPRPPRGRGFGRGGFDSRDIQGEAVAMALASGGFAMFGGGSGGSGGEAERVYTRFEDGQMTEVREFLGRTFLLEQERPRYQWKLHAEQGEFMGYMVQKATTELDGTEIEAWFTPQVPVQTGPGSLGGLPGLILVATLNDGETVYTAKEVDLAYDGDPIEEPTSGQKVTEAEFEEIVADRMAEMERTGRFSGGGIFRFRGPPMDNDLQERR